ncbi:MAG: signal recognition particle protein [Alphaproteobacteria bacterium]|nr:signal recognition particle protein [Alphaproteobacteria bacterium]MBU1514890.1 signal recognition particle protein [Alphaproteobacteria bacterium]MBU2093811.1 signal recognition particle protein [Alphaproteobacteria bacterium]MBU2149432.1 signal recognition particle protein [Alphaproteobacteria bacterium]MBU2305392.1 signal recognition particle protein [Alphaproteobacteria bacterium]
MFDALTDRLTGVFDRLSGRGVLSEKDVAEVMREIRVALLEADVALPVVRDFIAKATEAATGEAVIRSIRPADQVVKITYDGLVEMLGGDGEPEGLNLSLNPPTVILMAGLQGSGKTTTAGKLALRLVKDRKKVLLASLDTRRPAAMEQLGMLAEQAGANFLPIVAGQAAPDIARRAMQAARLQGFDILILDTAGRTTIDEAMMAEASEIAKISNPSETLLVADALTGQDAVRTAKAFHERLPLTGLVLTRADGDGRGGAALSMRAVTGLPIKFLGVSEKIDGLDAFDAQRVAGRILGRGDVVALVEKAAQELDMAKAEATARKLAKGQFDLDMMSDQLAQMKRMGGMEGMMGLLPGVRNMKKQISESGLTDKTFDRQVAIISSMTKAERKKPDILAASRKRRIAAGSGVDVAEVNRLLKQHRQMADAFKSLSKNGGKGFGQMAKMLGGGGGMDMAKIAQMTGGQAPTPEQMEEMQAKLKSMPGGLPKLPGLGGGLPPGFNPFKK